MECDAARLAAAKTKLDNLIAAFRKISDDVADCEHNFSLRPEGPTPEERERVWAELCKDYGIEESVI